MLPILISENAPASLIFRILAFKLIIGIILGVIVVLLIAGYGVCCFLAGDGEVLGHTYVDEQDLIGMDKDAVVTTVTDIYNNEYANIALNVSMNDSNYEIPVFDAMISPVDGVVEEAMDFGHGFFLTRGVAFIESMLTERYLKIIPSDL